LLSLRFVLENN